MKPKSFGDWTPLRSFFLFLLFLYGGNLQAQPPLKASPLNIFTLPGQSVNIDVLNNSELGSCGISGTLVNVLGAAAAPGTLQHGTAVFVGNNIVYIPATGFIGQDSLKYRLTCGTKTSDAIIYINMNDKPDVVKDNACTVAAQMKNWTIGYSYFFDPSCYLASYTSAVTGDIDNDGIVEIICVAKPDGDTAIDGVGRSAPSLAIFKGNNISAPWRVFNTVHRFSWSANQKLSLCRTKINNKDTTLILVEEGDYYLRAYNYLGQNVWTSSDVYHAPYSNYNDYMRNFLITTFADFNKDGIPEILVGSKVFDSATGNLLCSIADTNPADPSIAADLFNTGTLNFVTGNRIYDVSPSLNTLTLRKTITPPVITNADPEYTSASPLTGAAGGRVSAVDIDHDGKLDLVILCTVDTSPYYSVLYVADPVSGAIKASKYIPNAGYACYPFIGDIDGDGNIEIVIIKNQTTAASAHTYMIAYKYDGSSVLQEFWRLTHKDNSGSTGLTLFDFDQDGKAEIVYRDEQYLRIIDGTADGDIRYTDRNKAIFPNTSGTCTEYPIVADVDGDGQAEIIVLGGSSLAPGSNANLRGALWVFKSADPDSPWAPARTVWNTPAYNPVYVNEDLSIPAYPLNPATRFIDKNGEYLQPFNNFLQQSTLLNGEGKMLRYGPKLEFVNPSNPVAFTYPGTLGANSVNVSFSVLNTGDDDFVGPLYISAYLLKNGNFIYLGTYVKAGDVPVGTPVPVGYTLDFSVAGFSGDPRNFIQFRLNDKGNGVGKVGDNLPEQCTYFGNFSKALFGAPDYTLCPGENTIYFYPQNNSAYSYVWYNTNPAIGNPAPIQPDGESYTFTKSATKVSEVFYVEVYDRSTGAKENTYTVKTFLVPDTLVWTGTVDSDWNNAGNWNYPGSLDYASLGSDAKYKIPGTCTNVLIASATPAYPNLSNYSSDIHSTPVCNRIHFAPNAEVARTDTLLYNEAYVDLTLNTHQWYMIAPPLKNTYTGDYYITQPNPYVDDRLYEPMFFNAPNPQTLTTAVATWSGQFNNSDVLLGAGQGMAIWYNKLDQEYTYHNPVTTHLPKSDPYFRYYSDVPPHAPTLWSSSLNRTDNHRFIYEPLATNGLVPLALGNQSAISDGMPVLIGNPFMAHLNMDQFLTANNSEIYAGYKLASGVATSDGYMNNFVSWQRVGSNWIYTDLSGSTTNLGAAAPVIAPMQSFIVSARKANPRINAPAAAATTAPADRLKSAASDDLKIFEITAVRNDETHSKAVIIWWSEANNNFNADEDSYRLFPQNEDPAVIVYTRSSDGYALDINSFSDYSEDMVLGVRTPQSGQITLKFAGAENFAEDVTLYLNDTKEARTINLMLLDEYTFTKTADEDLFLEGRFFLHWVPNTPTGMENIERNQIAVQVSGRNVEILSKDGTPIRSLRIDDTQGRALVNEPHYGASSYHFTAPAAGVYLVKIQSQVKKVVVR
ncbi:MAG: FG-GAP-like repeat-containing protein [Dysgonamonadaceae bacterium]|jgi:hypothetical protein|nr:FG-GAP-like repeat-containing protein [Dysgonamonadaceae bacterium]